MRHNERKPPPLQVGEDVTRRCPPDFMERIVIFMDFCFETMLRRKQAMILPVSNNKELPMAYIMSFDKNLESLGYCLSPECIEAMKNVSIRDIGNLYDDTIKVLLSVVGGDVEHKPMYKNFPQSVMEADAAKLLYDQRIGYIVDTIDVLSGVEEGGHATRESVEFDGTKEEREAVEKRESLKAIAPTDMEGFYDFCRNLLSGKSSMSQDDKEIIRQALFFGCKSIIPESVPFKENLAFLAGILDEHPDMGVADIPFKTATDVLRLAVAFSYGDVSLAAPCKFMLNSRQRKLILGLFERVATNNPRTVEDMLRNRERFVRLAEVLHPRANALKYSNTDRVFNAIKNKKAVRSFASRVEAAINSGNISGAAKLLSSRPGEFARRLDWLLRTALSETARNNVLSSFAAVADQVSVPVLLTIRAQFINRNESSAVKVAFPKGAISKSFSYTKETAPIPEDTCKKVCEICETAICKAFSEKEKLGKVYLSEELRNYTVPFAIRSESSGSRTVSRGSRIKVPVDTKVLRAFVYWVGQDVDLSAIVLNEELSPIFHISFTNLQYGKIACHSGDITSAPNGATECIDFDLEALKSAHPEAKYIAFNVISYSGYSLSDVNPCFFGSMSRESLMSGEIFEPSTVDIKIDIDTPFTNAFPIVYDIEKAEYVWTDISYGCGFGCTIEGNMNATQSALYGILNMSRPNLYDLFSLHVKARGGELVDDELEAETVFSVTKGITPFDRDVIVADYL